MLPPTRVAVPQPQLDLGSHLEVRVVLSFRVTPALKRKLAAAAEENGRGQSQEAELRLERSFQEDRISKVAEQVERQRAAIDDVAETVKLMTEHLKGLRK